MRASSSVAVRVVRHGNSIAIRAAAVCVWPRVAIRPVHTQVNTQGVK